MKSHILIIADGRSPTARSWIETVRAIGYDVSLISTFACQPMSGLKHFHILPIAFSRLSGNKNSGKASSNKGLLKALVKRFSPHFQTLRYFVGPLTLNQNAKAYQRLLQEVQPDLVHALRIPFEGMLGSTTPEKLPFIAATWGNDLTLHAKGSGLMRRFTRRCLTRADGLTSDTLRDIRLAVDWGLDPSAPTLHVPGSGGIDPDTIRNAKDFDNSQFGIPTTGAWVVNTRGIRPGSVHQDVFFASIPKVLKEKPETSFICPGLQGDQQALNWIKKFDLHHNVFLLPALPQAQLWALFHQVQCYVSPSSHDGTPNSLLEAMAAGCFPIVGDIESLREWIEDGINGLLVNPRNPEKLADAILSVIDQPELRQKAAKQNLAIINQRAALSATRPKIKNFYDQFLD